MALFSRSKKTVEEATPAPRNVSKARSIDRNLSSVIVSPAITEKAMLLQDSSVYTFFVRKNATKYDVYDAVVTYFKVTPVKVNIVNKLPRTSVSGSRGRAISQPGFKKAYVYLKKGDSITIA